MKSEEYNQALPLSKRGKQSEQLASVDADDFDELKQKGLNLRALWRTIQRNVLLISGVTTVVAVATLYSGLTSPRSYEGDFRLLVEPITSEAKFTDPSVLSRDHQQEVSTSMGVDYPTLLQVLQSPGLLSETAKRIQIRYPDVSYDSLSKNLVVQRIGKDLLDFTNIVEVRYKGQDPKEVQFVLEELAEGYLKYSLENRKTRINGGVQFIENQLPSLQQRVYNLQVQLQTLQKQYHLIDPLIEGEELSKQVRVVKGQQLDFQRELQEQKSLYINLQRQLGLAPNEALAASNLSEDPTYGELLGQLKKIESQIAVESARFSEDNPSLQTLREKQKNLSLLLNREAERILGQNLPISTVNSQLLNFQNPTRLELIKQLINTANQVQVLKVRTQEFAQTEALLAQQARQLPAIMRQYNDLQRQLEISTKTLNQLLVQRETLRVEAAQNGFPWEVVSAPRMQRDAAGNLIPAPSGIAKKVPIVMVAGFLLGFGAAVLKDKSRNVFYTNQDIQDAIALPILGVIPFDKSAKHFSNSSAVVESTEVTPPYHSNSSLFLEAFNSLYARIRFFSSESPVQSLIVSSAAPGDGKTTIALHLAQATAAMGQRVLLVDANLRQPQIHTILGLSNQQGLSNLLSQNLDPNYVFQRSPLQDNLFVLTSGQLLPDSTRLLASNRMQYLIEQFETAFDLVIYDTPHLLGLADTNFMAAHTDGILMVIQIGKTNESEVMHVMNELNNFRLPVLGIVTNHVKESKNSSYGYYNRHHEQNYSVRPTFVKEPKISKTDSLTSAKQTDDVLR